MNQSVIFEASGQDPTVRIAGELTDAEGRRLLGEIMNAVSAGERKVVIDLGGVKAINSREAAWLVRAVRAARSSGAVVSLSGARGEVADFLDLIRQNFEIPPPSTVRRKGFFEKLGEKGIATGKGFFGVCHLVVDSVYWSFIAPIEGRGLRWKGILNELQEIGAHAVGIVCLINFLLGLVIAMLSAAQLRLFGMQILVANLVVIGFARELAVIMTGIVISARTGAAIAAELATMKVSEEIDALKGMGLNVSKFLIAPKVIAILISMPILTAMGFVMGVAGGFFLGLFSLGFNFDRWWGQTTQALQMGDITQGFVKSFFFAMIIVIVGCYNGLKVTGGASDVGLATTRSVVMDIFYIIVADMIFASLFYFVI